MCQVPPPWHAPYAPTGYHTVPWVCLSPTTSGSGERVFSRRIKRARVSRTWLVRSSTSSLGSPFLTSSSRRYCTLSRSLPTIRERSMSCSEVRVRVYVLFSIPQIYGDNMDWPNMVGGNYRSSTSLVNHISPPTMMTMMDPISKIYSIDKI